MYKVVCKYMAKKKLLETTRFFTLLLFFNIWLLGRWRGGAWKTWN